MNNLEIRINAFNAPIETIKNIVAKHIDQIGGTVWIKDNHERAYFPDSINLEVAEFVKSQPYNAYYDLKTGDFVCTVSKKEWDGNVEEYKNLYKDALKRELAN